MKQFLNIKAIWLKKLNTFQGIDQKSRKTVEKQVKNKLMYEKNRQIIKIWLKN